MAPKDLQQARIIQVLQENSKSLERMGWKNMDPEKFGESYMGLMKSLSSHAVVNFCKASSKGDMIQETMG